MFEDSTSVYELIIKFNNSMLIAKSTLFDVTYGLRLYKLCYLKQSNESNSESYTNNEIIANVTIKNLNDIKYFHFLSNGHYAIELIPYVTSNQCVFKCPYINNIAKNKEILCENCKKLINYIKIDENTANTSVMQCMDLHEHYVDLKIEKYLSTLNHTQYMFNAKNRTFIVDEEFSVNIPTVFIEDYKTCKKKSLISVPKNSSFNSMHIMLTIVLLVILLACIAVVIWVFSFDCFGKLICRFNQRKNGIF